MLDSRALLPAIKPAIYEYTNFSFFSLPSPLPSLPNLTQGLLIEVGLVDAKECATVNVVGTYAGLFIYTPPARAVSGSFIHSFQCRSASKDCRFTALTKLELELAGVCQSVSVRVSTVGAQGSVAAVGYLAQPAASNFLTNVTVTVNPAIEVLDDVISSIRRQGLSIAPFPLVSAFDATPPALIYLVVELPAAPNFLFECELVHARGRVGAWGGGAFAHPLTKQGSPPFPLGRSRACSPKTDSQPPPPLPPPPRADKVAKFTPVDLVQQLLSVLKFGLFFTFLYTFLDERGKRKRLFEDKQASSDAPRKRYRMNFVLPEPLGSVDKHETKEGTSLGIFTSDDPAALHVREPSEPSSETTAPPPAPPAPFIYGPTWAGI